MTTIKESIAFTITETKRFKATVIYPKTNHPETLKHDRLDGLKIIINMRLAEGCILKDMYSETVKAVK